MKKYFIITIDTEGDNLWEWHEGDEIHTENTRYLDRFQKLANKYGFKPVWLSNYEMISDDRFVQFIKKVEENQQGELGMHLHAWSTPPSYLLPKKEDGQPYLIEYPKDIMEQKIAAMTNIIINKTGIVPVSHRAGRWATNRNYFELLKKYGYKVDCSFTPHINWEIYKGQSEGSGGSNYENISNIIQRLDKGLLEVPVTILKSHHFFIPQSLRIKEVLVKIYKSVSGQNIWLRPNGKNLQEMLYILKKSKNSDSPYVMFMLHSSELMPGGSPTFKREEDVNKLYKDMEILFSKANKDYEGITLRDFERLYSSNMK